MDLSSISPASRTVPLGKGTVEITGLSLRKVTALLAKYPELLAFASGKGDLASLIMAAPEAAIGIIAVGVVTNEIGDNDTIIIKTFDDAPMGQQLDLLGSIIELTFAGERAVPFLASLVGSQENTAPISPETSQASSST